MREECIKEILKSYYKWKAVGVAGIWIGAGIACLSSTGDISALIMFLAALSSLLYSMIGALEFNVKWKEKDITRS